MSAHVDNLPKYSSLPSEDIENGDGIELSPETRQTHSIRQWLGIALVVAGIAAGSFLSSAWRADSEGSAFNPQPSLCTEPVLRREWRQLARSEQVEYIKAVQCLNRLPSKMGSQGRLSDDFPWSHRLNEHYGQYSCNHDNYQECSF
jgi:hypothetical protein